MPPISFTPKERNAVRGFADRLSSDNYTEEDRRRRRVGMLGAIAFYQFLLRQNRSPLGSDGKPVFRKEDDVERMDFRTVAGKLVGVKTLSRNYYKRVLVSVDELRTRPKDYYVGVRISEDERSAHIVGFATRKDMEESDVVDLGEGSAYECLVDDLRRIEKLLGYFPRNPYT